MALPHCAWPLGTDESCQIAKAQSCCLPSLCPPLEPQTYLLLSGPTCCPQTHLLAPETSVENFDSHNLSLGS